MDAAARCPAEAARGSPEAVSASPEAVSASPEAVSASPEAARGLPSQAAVNQRVRCPSRGALSCWFHRPPHGNAADMAKLGCLPKCYARTIPRRWRRRWAEPLKYEGDSHSFLGVDQVIP